MNHKSMNHKSSYCQVFRKVPWNVVANWKMHGNLRQLQDFLTHLCDINIDADNCRVLLAIPYPYLLYAHDFLQKKLDSTTHSTTQIATHSATQIATRIATRIALCAQNCSHKIDAPLTGEVSASQLLDVGCHYCLVGHSERRSHFYESDLIIKQKIVCLYKSAIKAIVCVGEDQQQKQQNLTKHTLQTQLQLSLPPDFTPDNTIIAYEPVWAIGAKELPPVDLIQEVVQDIRECLHNLFPQQNTANTQILYGGAVNAQNVYPLTQLEDSQGTTTLQGVLVGRASLQMSSLLPLLSV